MPYITTAEQVGREEALAQGIAVILEIKFGEAGQKLSERAHKIEGWEKLQKIMLELKYAKSLSDAQKLFDELELPTA
ncbi:MAG: hypothetical protein ACREOI_10550 [bacterium]